KQWIEDVLDAIDDLIDAIDGEANGPLQGGPLSNATTAHTTSKGKISTLRDGNQVPSLDPVNAAAGALAPSIPSALDDKADEAKTYAQQFQTELDETTPDEEYMGDRSDWVDARLDAIGTQAGIT
ncbi:MAG: hypothetical protein KAS72_14020, partial [Phycisphaerales bacterium]|nr:hypothetical protein [Phycisphaerales bacterium]